MLAQLDQYLEAIADDVSPHIPPISYCGRRKAHCGTPYSRRPANRRVNYAGADLWSVRRATASLRRPRDGKR